MNVLSLFDGCSCGMAALDHAGIKVDNYWASEVDKYAIQISKKNWPHIQHIGDVCGVDATAMDVDLLIGGSPCQGFSFAGKQLNFDDPRSRLFFEYVRIKTECNPKWFLLENVKMRQESQDIISEALGVEPVEINSALVSAQNRKRLYWTNIPFDMPEDKGILLKDILECETSEYVKVSKRGQYKKFQDKASCLSGGAHSGGNHSDMDLIGRCIQVSEAIGIKGHEHMRRVYSVYGKSPTVTAICGGNQERKIAVNDYEWRRYTPIECERLQTLPDNYTEGVSNTQRYKMLGNGWTRDIIAHIFKGMKQ